jgi:hypothetical protein
MAMLVTSVFGKLPLMSVQDEPPFVVLNTCPTESVKPEKPP